MRVTVFIFFLFRVCCVLTLIRVPKCVSKKRMQLVERIPLLSSVSVQKVGVYLNLCVSFAGSQRNGGSDGANSGAIGI